jgi:hypothetical protein
VGQNLVDQCNFSSTVTAFLCFLHLQQFLSQLGLLLFSIALKINELRSTSTLSLTLILVRCDQLVRAPQSHATTVHGDCKITVQFSRDFFSPLNRVIAKMRKVRSHITRVACIVFTLLFDSFLREIQRHQRNKKSNVIAVWLLNPKIFWICSVY